MGVAQIIATVLAGTITLVAVVLAVLDGWGVKRRVAKED